MEEGRYEKNPRTQTRKHKDLTIYHKDRYIYIVINTVMLLI